MQNCVEFTIITGLSGAGKSEAIRCFEDMGYFCIDNLPPSLIPKMAELCSLPGSKVRKVALVSDVRGGQFFDALYDALRQIKEMDISYQILFLEASDDTLIKRFKETRRRHPLAAEGQIIEGIKEERRVMERLRGMANIIINTTDVSPLELKDKIRSSVLRKTEGEQQILITVMSFGYKYGLPLDADLIMDVRFLPNPHYIESLREFDGTTENVRQFVLERSETKDFMQKFLSLLGFLMPQYVAEGKTHLVVAIGCTGGTHRSVALSDETAKFFRKEGYKVVVRHRDLERSLRQVK